MRTPKAQVARMSRAQRAQVARIAPRSWAHVATSLPCPAPGQVATSFLGRDLLEANPCRDIKLVSQHHSGHFRSRPQNGVATPFFLPSLKPGRDTRTRSRPSWRLPYVVTSISCRDFVSQQARSRRQFHVATSWRLNLCRDIKSMSRPPTLSPMSRHQIHVATPFMPTVGFPGRDLPHCYPCRDLKNDVATSTQLSPISATS